MSLLSIGRRGGKRPADPAEARRALTELEEFAGTSPRNLERLVRRALELRVPDGTEIVVEGRFPSGYFIVMDGRIEVYASGRSAGPAVKINELGPGDHFGEVGLIEGMPATATVRSSGACRLLRIPGRDLLAVLDDEPGVMSRFLEPISGALARTDPTYRLAADESAGKSRELHDPADLRRLAELGSDLGPLLGPGGREELLDRVAASAVAVLDAQACSIALLEDEQLVFRGVAGAGAEDLKGRRLALDRGITGSVLTSGQSVAIDDVAKDPRFDRSFASATGYVPRSLHAIRLEVDRGPLGVLQVLDAEHLRGRDDALEVLAAFAGLAALTIETGSVFGNLGRAVFGAAADVLEGAELAGALAEAARASPPGGRLEARLLAALGVLKGLPEEEIAPLLQAIETAGRRGG